MPPTLRLVLVSFLVTAVLLGCERSASGKPPNVLILSIESLRWDHVGSYGYSRSITPNMDRLSRAGVLFERAYAQCSWTKPSVASTFTSTYLSFHGVTNPQPSAPGDIGWEKYAFPTLRGGFRTMAEFFSKKGYQCYGWTGNRHLWSRFGFGRGFSQYNARMPTDGLVIKHARDIILSGRQPWFVFIHIMAPHWDYSPPPEYRKYDRYPTALPINGANWRRICDGEIKLSPQDLQHNIALYDGEIAFTDFMIGILLDTLAKKGLRGRTIIVVTSDHGEEFMEHGGVGHGRSLYEEVIRVPLIIAGHGVPTGRKVRRPVQNADIFPTLAALCGFQLPEGLQGANLVPLITGRANKWRRKYAYSEVVNLHAVVGRRFKYIFDPQADREELYDIIQDPTERNNLANVNAYAGIKAALDKHARAWLEHNRRLSERIGKAKTVRAPRKIIKDLRALGYLK